MVGMFEPTRMQFVSDCGSLIRQIALCLPAAFFEDVSPENWFRPLIPIGNLLAALPEDVDVLLLVDGSQRARVRHWLEMRHVSCSVRVVEIDSSREAIVSPWIQDALHVRTPASGHDARMEILNSQEAGPGRWLARFFQMPDHKLEIELPGGNHLVGPDFRLLGRSSTLPRNTGAGASGETPELVLEQLRALDGRSLYVFGYKVGDLDNPARELTAGDAEDIFGLDHQFGFHVDQFVSVTGLVRDHRPLLIVGEPQVVGEADTYMIDDARRKLDASVLSLRRQGFEVLRNPVPYVIAPDSGKRIPRLYNNLILENEIRDGHTKPMVWLPQFADVEPLEEFDRMNREIWQGLGFQVVLVPGWSYFASRNGALRCMTKVLSRG